MSAFFGIAFILFLLFTVLSYKQLMHISTVYSKLIKKYQGNYFIGHGQSKGNIFKLKKGSITLVVSDNKGDIVDTYIMEGFSIFSRLKRTDEFNSKNIFTDFVEYNKLSNKNIPQSFYISINNIVNYTKNESMI